MRLYNTVNDIKTEFERNKTQVIDFLVANTLSVEFSIPDVVKGNFSKALK